jgi:hypothetical protein
MSRLITCAWIETSSAETGSSQIRSGVTASARAMPTRWRWPPEKLVRIPFAEIRVQPDPLQQFDRALPRFLAVDAGDPECFAERLSAMLMRRGLSEANGSWKTSGWCG